MDSRLPPPGAERGGKARGEGIACAARRLAELPVYGTHPAGRTQPYVESVSRQMACNPVQTEIRLLGGRCVDGHCKDYEILIFQNCELQ